MLVLTLEPSRRTAAIAADTGVSATYADAREYSDCSGTSASSSLFAVGAVDAWTAATLPRRDVQPYVGVAANGAAFGTMQSTINKAAKNLTIDFRVLPSFPQHSCRAKSCAARKEFPRK